MNQTKEKKSTQEEKLFKKVKLVSFNGKSIFITLKQTINHSETAKTTKENNIMEIP